MLVFEPQATFGVVCADCASGVHRHDWLVLAAGFQDGACHYVTVVESSEGDEMVPCACGVV